MSKIVVHLDHPIEDGEKVTFKAPVNSENHTSLKVYYLPTFGADTETFQEFTIKDATGTSYTSKSGVFVTGAYVTVSLDTTNSIAYLMGGGGSETPEIVTTSNTFDEVKALIDAGKNVLLAEAYQGDVRYFSLDFSDSILTAYVFRNFVYPAESYIITDGGSWEHATGEYIYSPRMLNPRLEGTPTAPTAAAGTNTTQIATTAFVKAEIDNTAEIALVTTSNTFDEVKALYDAGKTIIFDDGPNTIPREFKPLISHWTASTSEYFLFSATRPIAALQSDSALQTRYYTLGNDVSSYPGWTYHSSTSLTEAERGNIPETSDGAANQSYTLLGNHAFYSINSPGIYSLTLTLSLSGWSAGRTAEWLVAFRAHQIAGATLSVTPPSGYTINWKDGVPTFAAGKFYEISFRLIAGLKLIIAYVAETDIS